MTPTLYILTFLEHISKLLGVQVDFNLKYDKNITTINKKMYLAATLKELLHRYSVKLLQEQLFLHLSNPIYAIAYQYGAAVADIYYKRHF